MKWRVVVVTAPRKQPTIAQCVDSIEAAGWTRDEILVKGEPDSEQVNGVWNFTNSRKLGVGWNTISALEMVADFESDFYLICQDDAVLASGLREYVEATMPKTDVLWCYVSERYDMGGNGWTLVSEKRSRHVYGSLCVALSSRCVDAILGDDDPKSRRSHPLRQAAGWDVYLVRWLCQNDMSIAQHEPSLIQHIGETSVCHPGMKMTKSRRHSRNVIIDATRLLQHEDDSL